MIDMRINSMERTREEAQEYWRWMLWCKHRRGGSIHQFAGAGAFLQDGAVDETIFRPGFARL